MSFKEGFAWGAATAAYQVEGSPTRAGGGESVWDLFTRREGKIKDGSSGLVACDHHRLFREDVALMRELGLNAYRFSVSWPRVLPAGTGKVHGAGLDFYDQLVDALLAANVTPWLTLYHWDLPAELYLRGGWLNRDSADWFAQYAGVVVEKLSDRVTHWMTLNEPQVFLGLGLHTGVHAPGDQLGWREVLRAGHHALLAHGRAVQVIRQGAKTPPQIGYAPASVVKYPASAEARDVEAARQAMFAVTEKSAWSNTWWTDPVFLGHYPEDGLALFGEDAPPVQGGDLALISQPLDFFGVNIYVGDAVRAGPDGPPEVLPIPHGAPLTAYGWPVTPEALYWGPKFFYERYGQPVVITENGVGVTDWVAQDGGVHDPQRADFLARYLGALKRAAGDGVDVAGYFQWTLMDNFEWAEGYRQRFGMVYVDFETQRRIPKDSARWYRTVIETNGAAL